MQQIAYCKTSTRNLVLSKLLQLIRWTLCFFLVMGLQASARGYLQKISLSMKHAPLQEIFKNIEQQTGYAFVYYRESLEKIHPIDVSVASMELEDVLHLILKDLPLEYTISNKVVVIKEKKAQGNRGMGESAIQASDIKGRVFNKQGEPLSNANVVVKGTNRGTITDANGQFDLKNIKEEDVLTISFIGYKSRDVKIGNQKNIILALDEANNELDETVVQAYGTTSRRLTTGNIAKVTAAEIEKQPVINPLQTLQGKIPGVSVTQTSGYASAPFKIEIRGRSNFNNVFTSDPLYIIDGVPLTVLEVSGRSGYPQGSAGFIQNGIPNPANGQSPFFSLDPQNIESIEVLKDADATAIYGSRGANGVILITTKKGKAGKSELSINVTEGLSKVSRYWDLMNTPQYLQMRREAYKNDGLAPTAGNAPDLLVWDTTKYTNWQKKIWGNTGKTTNVQIGLTSGNAATSFRLGAGYIRSTNILTVSGADQRGSLSFNLNHHLLNQKIALGLSALYSYAKSDMRSLPSNISLLAPDAPPIFDEKGNLNYAAYYPNFFPFTSLLQPYTSKTSFLNSSLFISIQVVKGLNFKTSAGYNTTRVNQVSLQPILSQNPVLSPKGMAYFGNNFNSGWIVEPQLEYNSFISKGKLNVLIGGSSQYTVTDGILMQGSNYTSDILLKSITAAPTKTASENYGEYKYAAIFSRINYNWKNKYILNLNARRDGSSRFGSGNQFGNFASAGAAWIFTEEPWMQGNRFLNFGKLRASYGTTGSDAVGDYQYLTRWSSTLNTTYAGLASLIPTQHANPNFQWQVNKKLEMALDLGLFKDRLITEVAFYQNRCSNQLVSIVLPVYTGFNNVTGNWPAVVQNRGWEISISGKLVETKNFSWSLNFNIAVNRNKLLAYPGFSTSRDAARLEIGKSVNIVKLLHSTGVDSQTGLYTFQDKNKDGVINRDATSPLNDLYTFDPSPKYSGGLGTSISYKNFQLSAWFNYVKQIGQNGLSGIKAGTFSSGLGNVPVSLLSRWQNPGDIAHVAKFTAFASDVSYNYFASSSDGTYTDASYLRLTNISINYYLPAGIIKKTGIKKCAVFINGQNLFTITRYKGLDPETQTLGSLPTARIIVGGLSVNF